MTPEAIQEAKDAVEIRMQEALKAEGVLEPEDLGEADEDTAYEMRLDGLVTKFAGVMAIVVALLPRLSRPPGGTCLAVGSSVTS